MEEDQQDINIDDKQLELKNLLINKSEEENEEKTKNEASSSSEEIKSTQETEQKDTVGSETKTEDKKRKNENSKNRIEFSKMKIPDSPMSPDKEENLKLNTGDTKKKSEHSKNKIEFSKKKIPDSPMSPDKEENLNFNTGDTKKKSEHSKNKIEFSKKNIPDSPMSPDKEENVKLRTPTPTRNSPEPSCAICLEHLTNKSFTNSCFHMFCFTCLVEWSKVKPECPLCKQSFTSIVHNVRSFQEYDQYHINARSRTPDSLRRFRYSTTVTSDRYMSRAQAIENSIVTEMASHRLRYAPHSVHHVRTFSQPPVARHIPCVFRRRIYEQNLWVRSPAWDRIRIATPSFFQRNTACTHRLLPWLNRELLAIMEHNEGEIGFMIDLIMSLILKYNITSPEFYTHIEPYTAPHTSHFIHEFYNFAISPYEMETYDIYLSYEEDPTDTVRVVSSPDSDVIPVPVSETSQKTASTSESRRKKKHSRSQRRVVKMKQSLGKIVLKRKSENNIWENVTRSSENNCCENVSSSLSSMYHSHRMIHSHENGSSYRRPDLIPSLLNFNEVTSTNSYEVPGPSTSWDSVLNEFAVETARLELDKADEVECVQDDEIEIVEVLKPKHERTPEIVNLSSGDEEEFTAADKVTSTVKEVPAGSIIELSSDAVLSTADEDDVMFLEEKNTSPKSPVPDAPIDYSLKAADKTIDIESEKSKSEENRHSSSSSRENTETEESSEPRKSLKSAVKVLSPENDSGSSSWSPVTKSKKRRAPSLENSSTESCSESTQVSELDSSIKQLKLRSVVAHFSFDQGNKSDTYTYHSYKKRKDKRKKKKHKHKRHAIYSSDSA